MGIALWIVVVLAVAQGLAEFFPVSSSGHLVILEALLGMRGENASSNIVFEVAVHIGTLGAVIIFYRRRVWRILRALAALVARGKAGYASHPEEMRYIGLLIVGSIPAGLAGMLLHDQVAATFNEPALTAALMVATGLYLLASRRGREGRDLDWRSALVVGCAQAIAILPGCSRSGWTIATGLLFGLGFAQAAEFSFMLSVPAVLGALLLEIADAPGAFTAGSAGPLGIGVLAAFLSGWLALKLLIGILSRGAFHRFAWYLFPVGAAALVYFLAI